MIEATKDELRTWFNDNRDKPRVIAIMSPTCGFCLIGHQAIKTYNSWLDGEDFVTKRIWIPMMAGDQKQNAESEAASTNDSRITDMYDHNHEVGRIFRDVLGLAAAAWDTYMLYEPGASWVDELPPVPARYEYQLYPSYAPDQTKLFTPSSFWWHVVESVGRTQHEYDKQVPALTRWLNEDSTARVGLEIPETYLQRTG